MVAHISEIRSFPPDPTTYPLFANAVYAEVNLQPGDLLYIPRRWWHWVTSFERNIALSMWHAADKQTLAVLADRADLAQVDVVSESTEFRARYFSQKWPVVIRSPLLNWPAFTKWTDDYLRAAARDERRYLWISPDANVQGTTGDHRTRVESVTMAEFLDRGRSSAENLWLAQDEATPGLLSQDWNVPEFWSECCGDRTFRTVLFFAFGREEGLTSPLHFDYYENLLAQVGGRKRVLLFSPAQSPYLYRKEQELIRTASEPPSTPAR